MPPAAPPLDNGMPAETPTDSTVIRLPPAAGTTKIQATVAIRNGIIAEMQRVGYPFGGRNILLLEELFIGL